MSLRQALSEFSPPKPTFTAKNLPDLSGKVYFITGGTSGIGLELTKMLYAKNARVYITSRSDDSAQKAITHIRESTKTASGEVRHVVMDLSDLDTVAPAMDKFLAQESQLHVAWLNAGVMNVPKGSRTKQGYELQWGTNVVAHFIINRILTRILVSTAQASPKGSVRVVWVSSDGHIFFSPKPDGIDWDDINIKDPNTWKADKGQMVYYGQSKVGNVLLAKEFARRYKDAGVLGVALNPGHLKTNLQRHGSQLSGFFSALLLHDASYGALTELYAGFSSEVNTGAYILPWGRLGQTRKDIGEGFQHRGTGNRLWETLEKETKKYLDASE